MHRHSPFRGKTVGNSVPSSFTNSVIVKWHYVLENTHQVVLDKSLYQVNKKAIFVSKGKGLNIIIQVLIN